MLAVGLLAFLLGIKHSYDADHLVAVSNFLTRTRSLKETVRMSGSWAAGHMLTATAVTFITYYFKEIFLSGFLNHLESLVSVMLIVLGAFTLKGAGVFHAHEHPHDGGVHVHRHVHLGRDRENHYHRHMFGIGVVHGLASNDELLALLTVSLSLTTLFGLFFGVVIFSFGVVLGMVAYGVILNYPLVRFDRDSIRRAVNIGAGCLSLAYGLLLMVV